MRFTSLSMCLVFPLASTVFAAPHPLNDMRARSPADSELFQARTELETFDSRATGGATKSKATLKYLIAYPQGQSETSHLTKANDKQRSLADLSVMALFKEAKKELDITNDLHLTIFDHYIGYDLRNVTFTIEVERGEKADKYWGELDTGTGKGTLRDSESPNGKIVFPKNTGSNRRQ